jgi:hypothetical protein
MGMSRSPAGMCAKDQVETVLTGGASQTDPFPTLARKRFFAVTRRWLRAEIKILCSIAGSPLVTASPTRSF